MKPSGMRKKTFKAKFINKVLYITLLLNIITISSVFAEKRNYEIPPSKTTSSSAPYISDTAMEQCVRLYNEIRWLAEDIQHSQVNRNSLSSINAYNQLIDQYSRMVEQFNIDCAGRQSESAHQAAQKLNEENDNYPR